MKINVKANFNKGIFTDILANIYNAKFIIEVEDSSGRNNSEIAAIHEFGSISRNIPRRSFIIDPLKMKKERFLKYVSRYFFFFKKVEKSVADLLAEEMHNVIQEAFDTGGWGTWQPLKPATIKRKGNDRILIDTEELRNSIKIRIKKI